MNKLLIASLALTIAMSLAACSNKEENADSSNNLDGNYAVQDVKDSTNSNGQYVAAQDNNSSEVSIDSEEESSTEVTTVAPVKLEHSTFNYNVDTDPNADKVTSIDIISIDGHLVSFPSNYATISKEFDLYIVEPGKYEDDQVKPNEENTYTNLELQATPKSGKGTIKFTFSAPGEEEVKLSEMKCIGVTLHGTSSKNEKLMTIALPNGVKFGSTYLEITDSMPYNITSHEMSEDEQSWTIKYSTEDGNSLAYFDGVNGGLKDIKLIYKP